MASSGSIDGVRVLFLTLGDCDFLADGLLHGLRVQLGDDVVDYPRQDILYRDISSDHLRRMHGRGFTLYGLLPDDNIDRVAPLERAAAGEFDIIVIADIWQQFGMFMQLLPYLDNTDVVVLDGDDWPNLYPYSRMLWRLPRFWMLPRAHSRVWYMKRELTPATFRIMVGKRLGLPILRKQRVLPIAFSIPRQKVAGTVPVKTKLFPRHVVDAEVAERIPGASVSYPFDNETSYISDLRTSAFGITTRRSGWDCLRHYELAASGCALCFRALDQKPAQCAPHGLGNNNCIVYRDADELLARIESLDDAEIHRLQEAALRWAGDNTTERRAEQFLHSISSRATATREKSQRR